MISLPATSATQLMAKACQTLAEAGWAIRSPESLSLKATDRDGIERQAAEILRLLGYDCRPPRRKPKVTALGYWGVAADFNHAHFIDGETGLPSCGYRPVFAIEPVEPTDTRRRCRKCCGIVNGKGGA